jgi:hypothetical protein
MPSCLAPSSLALLSTGQTATALVGSQSSCVLHYASCPKDPVSVHTLHHSVVYVSITLVYVVVYSAKSVLQQLLS